MMNNIRNFERTIQVISYKIIVPKNNLIIIYGSSTNYNARNNNLKKYILWKLQQQS